MRTKMMDTSPGNPGNTRHDALLRKRLDPAIYPLTLYYESACPLCNAEMTNLMLRNTAGHLQFVDVSAAGFNDPPQGASLRDLLTLIHATTADGRVLKGVEVFLRAYDAVGLGWVSTMIRQPLLRPLADWGYPVLARNRHRLPRRLVTVLFEGAARRAAERATAARCDADRCTR